MLDDILTITFLVSLLSGMLRIAAPIMFAALGELITERSGILNLGVEGTMLMGAFVGFLATYQSGSRGDGFIDGFHVFILESGSNRDWPGFEHFCQRSCFLWLPGGFQTICQREFAHSTNFPASANPCVVPYSGAGRNIVHPAHVDLYGFGNGAGDLFLPVSHQVRA
jgi:hypothetical protein